VCGWSGCVLGRRWTKRGLGSWMLVGRVLETKNVVAVGATEAAVEIDRVEMPLSAEGSKERRFCTWDVCSGAARKPSVPTARVAEAISGPTEEMERGRPPGGTTASFEDAGFRLMFGGGNDADEGDGLSRARLDLVARLPSSIR
jgi:hypothetical protein